MSFYKQILHSSSEAIIAADTEGTVTFWNRAAERIYGWRCEEALGKSILDLVAPGKFSEEGIHVPGMLRAGKDWKGECFCRAKDGRKFFAHISLSPLYDDSGGIRGGVAVMRDITNRENAETTLAEV
ncbi:MAG: PAS domain S-box protein, partial [Chitinivibrionales bacterium]|nr:PAS domain S-box protein [Chitinivibrionales bacterium]MBD3357184.1 PAS domain S-box protein [Chitinivibrionales bacterium]